MGIATGLFEYVWIKFATVHNQTGHLLGLANKLMVAALYALLFVIFGRWLHAFKIGVERKAKVMAGVALTVFITNCVEIFLSMAITGQYRFFDEFLWRYTLLAIIQSIILSLLVIVMINLYRKIIPPLRLIEITGERHNKLANNLNSIKTKYQIIGSIPYVTSKKELEEAIKTSDAVLINDIPAREQNDIVKLCYGRNKRIYVAPKISDIILKASENLNVVDTPLFLSRNQPMKIRQRILKRLFDISASFLAIILLSPILLITAIAIKLDDHGPVFFRQERITRDNQKFIILKFRSMIVDAEKDGKPHPVGEKDDRITRVGRVIRACRIDELPQLWNILHGEMSIVGPRPERVEHVEKYSSEIPEFNFRHKVKGGLTGYAQVYGKYNTSALDKLKLDLIYIANYSFIMDIQIIFETIKILLLRDSTEGFNDEMVREIHG